MSQQSPEDPNQPYQQPSQPDDEQAPTRWQNPVAIGWGLLIGLVVLVVVVNRISQRPTTPANHIATIGETISVPNWDLVTEQPVENRILNWGDFNSTTAVGTFLVVPIDLTNQAKQAYNVNNSDFEIIDSQGRTYETSDDLGMFIYSKYAGGKNVNDTVPPGVTAKIYLVFDINQSAQGLKIMFKQGNNPQVSLGI